MASRQTASKVELSGCSKLADPLVPWKLPGSERQAIEEDVDDAVGDAVGDEAVAHDRMAGNSSSREAPSAPSAAKRRPLNAGLTKGCGKRDDMIASNG